MTPYIDFHTHHPKTKEGVIKVFSAYYLDFNLDDFNYFTLGLHPWFIDQFSLDDERVLKLIQHPKFLGWGECGLDRLKGPELSHQNEIFKNQLEFCQRYQIKNIVLHSVKTYEDFYPYLKEFNDHHFIFHDYNGNDVQTHKFLELSNVSFSLGSNLFRENSKLHKALSLLPNEKIFLETDETNNAIESTYRELSKLQGLTIKTLKEIITQNFKRLYNLERGEF